MGYSKRDIDFHDDGNSSAWGGGAGFPAIDVKDQSNNFYDLQAAFPELTAKEVEDIGNRAWEAHRDSFWGLIAESIAFDVFGENPNTFNSDGTRDAHPGQKIDFTSAGRSGGWLVVTNLGGVEIVSKNWNALDVSRWGRFESLILAEVRRLNSPDALIETARALLKQDAENQEADNPQELALA